MVPSRSPSRRSACLGSSGNCRDCPNSICRSPIGCRGHWTFPALEQSLAEVVRRHDSLRMGFAWAEAAARRGRRFSRRHRCTACRRRPRGEGYPPETNAPRNSCSRKLNCGQQQEAWKPFDMSRAPLFRTRLLRLGHDDHVFLLILHHIIVDGWSIGILFEEVSEIYSALVGGRQAGLPEQTFQFSDFANWQRWWCTSELASRQIALLEGSLARGDTGFLPRRWHRRRAARLSARPTNPFICRADLVARLSALSRTKTARFS